MIKSLVNFFYMNGYGAYVFTAYGCVMLFLLLHWFIPKQRWRRYLRSRKEN